MTFSKFRRAEVDYWTDFKHRMKYGLLIALALLLAQAYTPVTTLISESRTYRDITGLSAFKNVQIDRVHVVGDTVTVWGSLQKVRCEKIKGSDAAYTTDRSGKRHIARFDPSAESSLTPISRPPSEGQDAFGPWSIISMIKNPKTAKFIVSHKCSEGMFASLVFEIPWQNYGME